MQSCESPTSKGFILGQKSMRQLREKKGVWERTEITAEQWASSQSRGHKEGKVAISQLCSLTVISGQVHNTVHVSQIQGSASCSGDLHLQHKQELEQEQKERSGAENKSHH